MELKLHQSVRPELRLNLQLLLKQHLELLTLPSQELERALEHESLSNPFLRGFFKRLPTGVSFEETLQSEPAYEPTELEQLYRSLRAELDG
ncbi:MAG: hypothetical protein GXO03_01265, partial [Aquificae bacterium]|nr:hypothetical protein [Aquificota bacterium]